MSILEKIKKNTTIKDSAILAQSKFFTRKDMVPTSIPIINVALSGRMDGGLTPGLTMWAGPSKHFKTAFSLLMARSYLDKYPDAALLFYDSEFGTPQSYFDSFGIDTNRVLHTPITDLEQLKFDIMQQMDNIDRGDRVMIVIDSIGNLASKKEVQDALDGKSVADMSRAKQIKSLFRMVTPHLTIKDIPLVVVNHTYMEQCLAGDTLIKTLDGLVPISNINVGDMVYAINGVQKVTHKYTPDDLDGSDKRFLELEFDDGSKVQCTHNHRFLIDSGEWVQAEDLKIGQFMK
jgi:RecA/RadA recombinase